MSFDFEQRPDTELYDSERYLSIEEANKASFYLTNPHRSFDAYQSVHSFGPARRHGPTEAPLMSQAVKRVIAAGNMSPLGPYGPVDLTEEERIVDATKKMSKFLSSLGIPETSVYMLRPNRDYSSPLVVVDVDAQDTSNCHDWPVRLDTPGDFIYTRDPNKVLAVRPADCPVMIASADTPEGKLYMMVHYAWRGAASGHVEQTAAIFNDLGVDQSTLELYLTPGGHAESFPYKNYPHDPLLEFPGTDGLFLAPTEHSTDTGEKVWDFGIDTPKFVYDQLLKHLAITPQQIFCDTSDTSSLAAGYSSHSRSSRLAVYGESNTRDIVLAVFRSSDEA